MYPLKFKQVNKMKSVIKQIIIITTFTLICESPIHAQEDKKYNFIGINPGVTVEPYYEKGEFDINIFPLVYQRSLSKRFDIRLASTLNLGVRNNGNGISHMGIETAFPIYLKKKEIKSEIPKGFFVAPILSLGRNKMEAYNSIGLWVEPGYHLLFENNFAMTFGLQLGGTYFPHDNEQARWGNHFGIIIIFGKWL